MAIGTALTLTGALPASGSPGTAEAQVGVAASEAQRPFTGDTVLATSDTVAAGVDEVELADGRKLMGLREVKGSWVASVTADGKGRFTWGSGIAVPALGTTAASGASSTAAQRAVCSLLVDNVRVETGQLRSNTLVTCSNYGTIQTTAQFRRSSYRGFLNFGASTTSGVASGTQQDLFWNINCREGGGTYDYQLRARSVTSTAGTSAYYASNTANRYNCGTGP